MRYVEYLGRISENIKLQRTGLGWSQETLAEKAGVSRSTIQFVDKLAETFDLEGDKKKKAK